MRFILIIFILFVPLMSFGQDLFSIPIDNVDIEEKKIDPPGQKSGYYCLLQGVCSNPNTLTDVAVDHTWTQYVAFDYIPGGPGICIQKGQVSIYVYDTTWKLVTNSTVVKRVSGIRNPGSIQGQNSPSCNANNTPRGYWDLALNNADCGTTYELRIDGNLGGYYDSDYVTVSTEACPVVYDLSSNYDNMITTSKIDDLYFTDNTILYWFLGVKLVFISLWLLYS